MRTQNLDILDNQLIPFFLLNKVALKTLDQYHHFELLSVEQFFVRLILRVMELVFLLMVRIPESMINEKKIILKCYTKNN